MEALIHFSVPAQPLVTEEIAGEMCSNGEMTTSACSLAVNRIARDFEEKLTLPN